MTLKISKKIYLIGTGKNKNEIDNIKLQKPSDQEFSQYYRKRLTMTERGAFWLFGTWS